MKSTCAGTVAGDIDDHFVNYVDYKVRFYQFFGVFGYSFT